jgi:hypothetical protein
MNKRKFAYSMVGVAILALTSTSSQGASYSRPIAAVHARATLAPIQFFPGWRGCPGWRGPWRGPTGWRGRPYWFARPWVRRPYYGTIIAGVALGTLITVAAVGAVPPRPAPNLCWYWADPYGNRGYWDYCG